MILKMSIEQCCMQTFQGPHLFCIILFSNMKVLQLLIAKLLYCLNNLLKTLHYWQEFSKVILSKAAHLTIKRIKGPFLSYMHHKYYYAKVLKTDLNIQVTTQAIES